jgi:hypothetical protein
MNNPQMKSETQKFQALAVEKMFDQARRKTAEPGFDNREIIAAMRKACFADIDELEASGDVVIPK